MTLLNRSDVFQILRTHYPQLAKAYGVKRLGVFGSYAKGQPTDASDVDIVVEFDRPIGLRFIEFAEKLELLMGRKVDILTPAGIQTIRSPRVAQEIIESIVYV